MKNKRNTRRGRAKRWTWEAEWGGVPVYRLRRTAVEVWKGRIAGDWLANDTDQPFVAASRHSSRAAAMKAAECLARASR